MIAREITIGRYVAAYALERDISQSTVDQLEITARVFERWHGSPVSLGALTDELVNRWLVEMSCNGRSPATVACQRKNLLALWRSAHEADLAQSPRKIRRIRQPETLPEAWSAGEVRLLLETAEGLDDYLPNGIPHASWWSCFVRVSWDTALRLGDVLALRFDQIGDDGRIRLHQEKTNRWHLTQLSLATVDTLNATVPPERELALPWPHDRRYLYTTFRKLVKAAGIRKGSSKWLRRSSATAVEAEHPGAAMAHLGHRTPGLAYRHYVDPRLLQNNRPMPPEL